MVSVNNFLCNSFNSCYMLGGSELEEIKPNHLDGHKGSRPVPRIGNGATNSTETQN